MWLFTFEKLMTKPGLLLSRMEPEIPEWLNNDFLSTVLQGGEHKEPTVTVLKFSPSLAVAPGNNYMSHMFRVKVEYKVAGSEEEKKTSLMVKAPFTKGIVTEMADRMDVFSAEEKVYTELLPLMREKSNHEFGPRSYFCPVKGIVLGDLKEEGYVMCDRLKQLDFEHCEIALKTLAKFHATSVACYHENPELVSSFKEKMFIEATKEEFGPWLNTSMAKAGSTIAEVEGCEAMGEYISSRAKVMLDFAVDRLKPKASGLNVLNHGDFWNNNMMFKYNESGDVEDVKIIDYQMIKYTTPVIDLIYFIWTSARDDALGRYQDLISIYRQTLNNTLQELGCEEHLSEEEFMDDLKLSTDWAVYLICQLLPYTLGDSDNLVNFEDISEADFKDVDKLGENIHKVYEGKYYKAAIPNVVKNLSTWLDDFKVV